MKTALLCFILFALGSSLFAANKPDVLVILADQWSPRYTAGTTKRCARRIWIASQGKG
jgi:hypothetical protein